MDQGLDVFEGGGGGSNDERGGWAAWGGSRSASLQPQRPHGDNLGQKGDERVRFFPRLCVLIGFGLRLCSSSLMVFMGICISNENILKQYLNLILG